MKWFFTLLKKLVRRKLFWFILILVIIGGIVLVTRGGNKVEYVTEKVSKGTLIQTVSETGTIQAATEINLNFKGAGTITSIEVKEGDQVKAGDLLARLDAGNLEIQVRQAQANLDIARASLNKFLAGASNEDINVSAQAVNSAKIAYENAKTDLTALSAKIDSDINNFQQGVEIGTTNLADVQISAEQGITNSRQSLLSALDASLVSADHGLDAVKVILDDLYLNGTTNNKYSAKNLQYKNESELYYNQGLTSVLVARNLLSLAKVSLDKTEILAATDSTKLALEVVRKDLESTFLALTYSITDFKFNEAALEAYKLNIKAQQGTVEAQISALNMASQSYNNALISYDSQINAAQGNLDTVKNNLASALSNKDLQLATTQSSIDSALGAYNLAKAQLDLKKASPRQVDIAIYQAQVNQAKATLDLALRNLDDYTISAPTDGTIVFVNNVVGEQFGFGQTSVKSVITMLGTGQFEIDVDVPESDIVKVKVGNKAAVTLDAYGNEVKFSGQVIFIDLAQTNIQDVVYYKVKVAIDPTDKEIKTGMTANLDIVTATLDNVLYLPNRAIKQESSGQKYVEILKFGNVVETLNVETGLKGDTGTEIKRGLQEGQEVIISKKQK